MLFIFFSGELSALRNCSTVNKTFDSLSIVCMNGSRTKNPDQRYILKVSAKISGLYFEQSGRFCHVNSLDTITMSGESVNTDLYKVRLGEAYHTKRPNQVSAKISGFLYFAKSERLRHVK